MIRSPQTKPIPAKKPLAKFESPKDEAIFRATRTSARPEGRGEVEWLQGSLKHVPKRTHLRVSGPRQIESPNEPNALSSSEFKANNARTAGNPPARNKPIIPFCFVLSLARSTFTGRCFNDLAGCRVQRGSFAEPRVVRTRSEGLLESGGAPPIGLQIRDASHLKSRLRNLPVRPCRVLDIHPVGLIFG